MNHNFYGNFPPYYMKGYPYHPMGYQHLMGSNNGNNYPPPNNITPWNMLTQSPNQNFEHMMAPYHQFHQQQQAFLHSSTKQNYPAAKNPNYQSQPDFTSMFQHVDGFINTANKYYPYIKKAGSFLSNINKIL